MHISRLFFYCSAITLLAACGGGGDSQVSQPEPQTAYPSQGTVLSSSCDGANLVQQVADGSGGSNVSSELAPNQCGYFTEPVSFTIPQNQYSADGNFVQWITPLDMNGDGRNDLLIHNSGGPENINDPTSDSQDSLVVFLNNIDGTFTLGNLEVFGVERIELDALARKLEVIDFNQDGFMDVAYALNREDGRLLSMIMEPQNERERSTLSSWASEQKIVMSNGDGTYDIDVLNGDPVWQHAVAVATTPEGFTDVIYTSYALDGTDPANAYRWLNGQWNNVSTYPALNNWEFIASRPMTNQGINYSQYIISAEQNYNNQGQRRALSAEVYKIGDNGWENIDQYVFGEFIRDQRFDNGIDQYDSMVTKYKGEEVVNFELTEMCSLMLNTDRQVFIGMLDASILPDSPPQIISEDDIVANYQIYIGLEIVDDELQEVDILEGVDVSKMDVFFDCVDLNNDGFEDLVVHNLTREYGIQLFINNSEGKLINTPLKGLDDINGNNTSERAFLLDINSDGFGDHIKISTDNNEQIISVSYGQTSQ